MEPGTPTPAPSPHANPTLDGMERVSLPITGMSCAACAARIEKSLRQAPGVRKASVNFARDRGGLSLQRHLDPGVWEYGSMGVWEWSEHPTPNTQRPTPNDGLLRGRRGDHRAYPARAAAGGAGEGTDRGRDPAADGAAAAD